MIYVTCVCFLHRSHRSGQAPADCRSQRCMETPSFAGRAGAPSTSGMVRVVRIIRRTVNKPLPVAREHLQRATYQNCHPHLESY